MRSLKYAIMGPHGAGSRFIHSQPCVTVPPLGPEAKQPPLTLAPGGRKRGWVCEVTEALFRGPCQGSK